MTAKEHLYYGFGQIVYCLAFSDGEIQDEEKTKLESIVNENSKDNSSSVIQITHIIFQLLEKESIFSADEMLEEGIKNMKLGDHHFSEEMKETFLRILLQIAEAFPPTTEEESQVVDTFKTTFFNHQ